MDLIPLTERKPFFEEACYVYVKDPVFGDHLHPERVWYYPVGEEFWTNTQEQVHNVIAWVPAEEYLEEIREETRRVMERNEKVCRRLAQEENHMEATNEEKKPPFTKCQEN